jgi:hypothetical protein
MGRSLHDSGQYWTRLKTFFTDSQSWVRPSTLISP